MIHEVLVGTAILCRRRLGASSHRRPRALQRRRTADELRRLARRALRRLRGIHLRTRAGRSGRGMPLHHVPVPGGADGILEIAYPLNGVQQDWRRVRQPARIVGPVWPDGRPDALHRTWLADQAVDPRSPHRTAGVAAFPFPTRVSRTSLQGSETAMSFSPPRTPSTPLATSCGAAAVEQSCGRLVENAGHIVEGGSVSGTRRHRAQLHRHRHLCLRAHQGGCRAAGRTD